MNLLLALLFASGVGLLWAETVCGLQLDLERLVPARIGGVPAPALLAAAAAGVAAGGGIGWLLGHLPILAFVGAAAGGYAPWGWARRRRDRAARERERAWPAVLAQLADALEAGIAFPAAVALTAETGPAALRSDLAAFHTRLRSAGLEAALDQLAQARERTTDTIALFLRAGLLELPAGGLAPVLRDLSQVLSERLEAREKARTRAASLQLEAALLALSPIALLLLVGSASPGYLNAYRTPAGTFVSLGAGLLIGGCYLLMRQLGRIPEPQRTHQ